MSVEPAPPRSPTALPARLLTAAILISVLLGVLWLNSLSATAVLFGIFIGIAAFEWATLLGWTAWVRGLFVLAVAALCVLGGSAILRFGVQMPIFFTACIWWGWVAAVLVAAQKGRDMLPTGRLAWAMLGCLVLVPSYLALAWLQLYDRWLLLGLFALIWTADTSAYFAGRAWGVRRLASRISPGKTWAGVVAALVLTPLVGLGIAALPGVKTLSLAPMAALGCLIIVTSIVGDLFESLVKRRGGFKDSGTILPGHGGVLDRIDSLLAAAPVYVSALTFMANTQ